MSDALARRLLELRSSVVCGIALATGWLTPAEKIYALRTSRTWDEARSRDQADLLMAVGAYEEAIPRYAAFAHWRKVGDAKFALGDVEGARESYQRVDSLAGLEYTAFRAGPDNDRLIALAIGRDDWADVLRLVRAGEPDPIGGKDVTFGGGSRAKGPLVKLCAHAAVATGDARIGDEMCRFFGLDRAEVDVFLGHARSGAYARDVAKLGKPPLLRVAPSSLAGVMEDGNTDRSAGVAAFLENLEAGFRDAHRAMTRWLALGDDDDLATVTFWLTRSGSYEVFRNCLFALQCETGMFFEAGPKQIEFYARHPWITRAGMRELLEALVATGRTPSAHVLFGCVLQMSASIISDIERGTFDIDRVDPLVMIRAHPVWAEGIIAAWMAAGQLERLWSDVLVEAKGQGRIDTRRLPAFATLCDAISDQLLSAWKRDMETVRWKAEESAFLSLKSLLPGVAVERHAVPSWLAPQHLDMHVPGAALAVEYQGEQHYRPVAMFGGEPGFAATVRRDENKRRLCRLAGVRLEYIRFDEDASSRLKEIAGLCLEEMARRGG